MTKLKQLNNNQVSLSNKVSSVGFITKIMFPHWVRLLIWSLQLPRVPYMRFMARLITLWSNNGATSVVLYCKEATRIVQAFVSGNPVFVSKFVISLVGGLPTIIPGPLRSLIRQRDSLTVRAVLSIFAVYRVISIPGKIKLSTITDPFKGLSETLPYYEVKKGLSELTDVKSFRLKPIKLSFLGTAGPNSSVSLLGIWKDIKTWQNSSLLPILKDYISRSPGGEEFWRLISQEMEILQNTNCLYGEENLKLGKLSEKNEAAGKVRVFAITDAITQSVMKPLSESVFSILKTLPMDGTFDQDRPVRHLKELWLNNSIKDQTLYSYDLSAATDRLPLKFQQQVLACLVGTDQSLNWGKLLTDREWYLKGNPYKYSVGQPMGALSSWAMLALSHHVLVRISALRVGYSNFTDYALLGDDIVIANTLVAKSYLSLMEKYLGVEINLSKSLKSKHSFEFAKRLITKEGEVSPVGAKNLLVGLKSLKGLPSILLDLSNKGLNLTEDLVTKMYESIPTVRNSQVKELVWLVNGPFGFVPTVDGLSPFTRLNNSLSAVSIHSFLSMIDNAIYQTNLKIWDRNLVKMDKILSSLHGMETIPGFDLENSDSKLYHFILDRYYEQYSELLHNKPTLPPTLLGPVFVSSYLRKDYTSEVVKMITDRIKSTKDVTFTPLDPFQIEKVILPLSEVTGPRFFWELVMEQDRKMRSLRGIRGMLSSQIIKVR